MFRLILVRCGERRPRAEDNAMSRVRLRGRSVARQAELPISGRICFDPTACSRSFASGRVSDRLPLRDMRAAIRAEDGYCSIRAFPFDLRCRWISIADILLCFACDHSLITGPTGAFIGFIAGALYAQRSSKKK